MANRKHKWFNVARSSANKAEVTLSGDIVTDAEAAWWYDPMFDDFTTLGAFSEALKAAEGAKEVLVRINSGGGTLGVGLKIYNMLRELGAKITCLVDYAASSASVIMCAGDRIEMLPGSQVMIHGVAGEAWGWLTIEDLQKMVGSWDAAERTIAEVYNKKTGKDIKELRALMAAETWYTAEEAVAAGFADEVIGGFNNISVELDAKKEVLVVAGVRHDISGLKNIARAVKAQDKPKEVEDMTLEELKEQYPELVEELRKEIVEAIKEDNPDIEEEAVEEAVDAVLDAKLEAKLAALEEGDEQDDDEVDEDDDKKAADAERARLKAIDKIAPTIGDADLVNDAKYGKEPCDAATLALRAAEKQAKLGSEFLDNLKADAGKSGTGKVAPLPKGGNEAEAEINSLVDEYQRTLGKEK